MVFNRSQSSSNSSPMPLLNWLVWKHAVLLVSNADGRIDRSIAEVEAMIESLEDQIADAEGAGGGGSGSEGTLVTLAELAELALQDPRFDELEDFDDDFGADDVTELLSHISRNRQGFFDFFGDSIRRCAPRGSGQEVDRLRLDVASALGVTIDTFFCPQDL